MATLGGIALMAGLVGQSGIHRAYQRAMDETYEMLKKEISERVGHARAVFEMYEERGDRDWSLEMPEEEMEVPDGVGEGYGEVEGGCDEGGDGRDEEEPWEWGFN